MLGGWRQNALPLAALAAIVAGFVARLTTGAPAAEVVWYVGLVVTGAPIVWGTLRAASRGRFATDIVAMLAIVGAVLLAQPLAGLVIVLMQSGGEALERAAEGRASAAVRDLEAAAPQIAHRLLNGIVQDVAADDVAVGDLILVRPGELLPCDGVVVEGRSAVDTARITGEPVPLQAAPGTTVMSGTINGSGVLQLRATARAAESQYARIVELVRTAQATKAPLQRLAERYAVWFTPATLAACAATYALTGDPIRVLAVLVVATPCPLILATPIAIIGGVNRAARRRVIVRHGGALERLSKATTAVFDKTGTLTIGEPQLDRVRARSAFTEDDVLRFAGALEQGSSHRLARVVVDAALAKLGGLPPAARHVESPGRGLSGVVDGQEVHVGARPFVLEHCPPGEAAVAALESGDAKLRAYVAVAGRLAGTIEYADLMRPGIRELLDRLRADGIQRMILLSGDHTPNARNVAAAVGIPEVHGDLLPEDKTAVVRRLMASGEVVMMVGDGTNDAPALSTADVGIAMAGHGGGVTTESADVIVLIDELDRVGDAMSIAKKTIRVARQSIWVGLGLSGAAMVFAAYGMITPLQGAVIQEAIDVAVILNALRSSR